MHSVNLDQAEFYGKVSRPAAELPQTRVECGCCGSTLAGRREKVRRQTTAGICYVVESFRCRCGAVRRIKREVAAR